MRVLPAELVEVTGLSADEVERALNALMTADGPYLTGQFAMQGLVRVNGMTERARRAVGAWPTADSLATELLGEIERAADAESDPGTTSRMRSALGVLTTDGRAVLVGVVSAWAKAHLGL